MGSGGPAVLRVRPGRGPGRRRAGPPEVTRNLECHVQQFKSSQLQAACVVELEVRIQFQQNSKASAAAYLMTPAASAAARAGPARLGIRVIFEIIMSP